MLSEPRRAQAQSHLPENRPDARSEDRSQERNEQAHAVTSRVTSGAFWFYVARVGSPVLTRKDHGRVAHATPESRMFDLKPIDIDIERLCEHLAHDAGRPVSDVEAALWLREKNLVPYGDGWLADSSSLPFVSEFIAASTTVVQLENRACT
jgi:hypothetical protein